MKQERTRADLVETNDLKTSEAIKKSFEDTNRGKEDKHEETTS